MAQHLLFLKENYPVIFPHEKKSGLSVCLTFDDATFDFYHTVFPLLKKLQMKAILAVPIFPILASTSLSPEKRLKMEPDIAKKSAAFCTWKEIQEMADSPFIEIASHSYSHEDLSKKEVDLDLEILQSKKTLEDKIKTRVKTFIYPYGRCNRRALKKAREHYTYSMRIGSAFNFFSSPLLYRVPCDNYAQISHLFKPKTKVRLFLKTLVCKIRRR